VRAPLHHMVFTWTNPRSGSLRPIDLNLRKGGRPPRAFGSLLPGRGEVLARYDESAGTLGLDSFDKCARGSVTYPGRDVRDGAFAPAVWATQGFAGALPQR
jgi:hypothetical protein